VGIATGKIFLQIFQGKGKNAKELDFGKAISIALGFILDEWERSALGFPKIPQEYDDFDFVLEESDDAWRGVC